MERSFYAVLLTQLARIVDMTSLPWPLSIRQFILEKRTECIEIACRSFSDQIPETIARSVSKRQYEFIIGRLATEVLLIENGISLENNQFQLWQDRPLWKSGVVGSISHSHQLVAVSIALPQYSIGSMGIDIEFLDQEEEITVAIRSCFTPEERVALEQIENGLLVGFSMKEALFKCLHPLVGTFIDFLDAEITHIDTIAQSMNGMLCQSLGGNLNAGTQFQGHYRKFRNHVWTGVFWSSAERDGVRICSTHSTQISRGLD